MVNGGERRDRSHDVCPATRAGFLTTPLRRLINDPGRILRGLVHEGDTAVDFGCGPGFFTLPMAQMVGPRGRVIAIDLQAEMLERLRARLSRAGLAERVIERQCAADTVGEIEPSDFALAFYMVHEVPDAARFLREAAAALKPGGRFLLVEPSGHVSEQAFADTMDHARAAGLEPLSRPRIRMSRAALLAH
jgi:ubiquinone/menaquinone biosynthesis C-methylase UbiE